MEWISVEERLPKFETKILMLSQRGVTLGICLDGQFRNFYKQDLELKTVSHWCEIPPLPQKAVVNPHSPIVYKYPRNLICAIYGELNYDEIGIRVDDEIVSSRIDEVFECLRPNEEKVLRMRFGFYGKNMTLKEIGEKLELTKERIRQIENKALRKLKHPRRRGQIETGVDIGRVKEQVEAMQDVEIKNQIIGDVEIRHLDLSARAYNCLARTNDDNYSAGHLDQFGHLRCRMRTVKDVLDNRQYLHTIRNMGAKSLQEIDDAINKLSQAQTTQPRKAVRGDGEID